MSEHDPLSESGEFSKMAAVVNSCLAGFQANINGKFDAVNKNIKEVSKDQHKLQRVLLGELDDEESREKCVITRVKVLEEEEKKRKRFLKIASGFAVAVSTTGVSAGIWGGKNASDASQMVEDVEERAVMKSEVVTVIRDAAATMITGEEN